MSDSAQYTGNLISALQHTTDQVLLREGCRIEVPRSDQHSDPCGRNTVGKCIDCGTPICGAHVGTIGDQLFCTVCASERPSPEELLDAISDCADVVSPKHYPRLVRQLESLLKRSGRAV